MLIIINTGLGEGQPTKRRTKKWEHPYVANSREKGTLMSAGVCGKKWFGTNGQQEGDRFEKAQQNQTRYSDGAGKKSGGGMQRSSGALAYDGGPEGATSPGRRKLGGEIWFNHFQNMTGAESGHESPAGPDSGDPARGDRSPRIWRGTRRKGDVGRSNQANEGKLKKSTLEGGPHPWVDRGAPARWKRRRRKGEHSGGQP